MKATEAEIFERLNTGITRAGYESHFDGQRFRLEKVGYANKSVSMTISLIDVQGERLIEFESELAEPTTFEYAALGIYEGNLRCRVVSFSAVEVPAGEKSLFQIAARTHLYADYFSEDELVAMLKIYTRELDDIDDEIVKIVAEGKLNGRRF